MPDSERGYEVGKLAERPDHSLRHGPGHYCRIGGEHLWHKVFTGRVGQTYRSPAEAVGPDEIFPEIVADVDVAAR